MDIGRGIQTSELCITLFPNKYWQLVFFLTSSGLEDVVVKRHEVQGGIQVDESPLDAMYRELDEEIGLKAGDVEILG